MSKPPKYRLEVLIVIKDKAKKAAEKELAHAIKRLDQERLALQKLEEKRKALIEKIQSEKMKMREKIAEGGRAVKDPQMHLNFLRKLDEDLEKLEIEITDQKQQVKRAENQLQRCRRDYVFAAQELNVMEKHKELSLKKIQQELNDIENKKMNELGTVVHQMRSK